MFRWNFTKSTMVCAVSIPRPVTSGKWSTVNWLWVSGTFIKRLDHRRQWWLYSTLANNAASFLAIYCVPLNHLDGYSHKHIPHIYCIILLSSTSALVQFSSWLEHDWPPKLLKLMGLMALIWRHQVGLNLNVIHDPNCRTNSLMIVCLITR